jgi:hypothetical protein
MRILGRALIALAVFAVVVATAAAGGGNALRASGSGVLFPVTFDPNAIAARCPAGHTWFVVFGGVGEGRMESNAYTGPVGWTSEHCTRLVVEMSGLTVGKTGGAVQTFSTPDGNLTIAHTGGFVLKGTFPVDYRTDGTASYTVTGGTDVFAGASGHGRIDIVDSTAGGFTFTLNGSLKLAG